MAKRLINRIVIHCSATKCTQDFTAEQVKASHVARGFQTWGYHFYIRKSGEVQPMRPIEEIGAHVRGHNANSIGICYEGGLDASENPADTRTPAQKQSMIALLNELMISHEILYLDGHRDLSPDLNDNGIVEPDEWIKMCPCFEVHSEYNHLATVLIKP